MVTIPRPWAASEGDPGAYPRPSILAVLVAVTLSTRHSSTMTTDVPHPYSVIIETLKKPEGHFGWALRKHGKLAERSDRPFLTEAKAFENAMRAIEMDMKPSSGGRR